MGLPLYFDDEESEFVYDNVPYCPRCGLDHRELPFRELSIPEVNEDGVVIYTHYSECLKTGHPILGKYPVKQHAAAVPV